MYFDSSCHHHHHHHNHHHHHQTRCINSSVWIRSIQFSDLYFIHYMVYGDGCFQLIHFSFHYIYIYIYICTCIKPQCSHNASVLAPVPDKAPSTCNCRQPGKCPLSGNCLTESWCTRPLSQCHISLTNTITVWQRARSKRASMVTPTHPVQKGVAKGKLSCPSTSGNFRTTTSHID